MLSPTCFGHTCRAILALAVFVSTCLAPTATADDAEHYPAFSWDTVPVYAHMRKVAQGFTDEEVEFLATHYDFITIEKAHGIEDYGTSEAGIITDARRLKAVNPDIKVLFYWNGLLGYPMYAAHDEFLAIPDGALRRLDGELDLKNASLHRYDLSNPEVRDWWISVAEDALAEGDLDGVFIDALPQVTIRPQTLIARIGADKQAALSAGLDQLLIDTRARLGPEKIVVYNGIRSIPNSWDHGGLRYLAHTDGVITEHFAAFNSATPDMMALDIERMQTAAASGAIMIFKGWPGFTWLDSEMMERSNAELAALATDAITFPLAAFLIVAEEHSYFNYTWGYQSQHGALDWHPEFDKPLGAPRGAAVRDGWTYTRQFEHASVFIDLETKSATIDWMQP